MKMLLISHQGAASGMKTAASLIAGDMADGIDTIELTAEAGIESFTEELDTYLKAWKETGKTGVIFADLKGGTPYNKAEILLAHYGMKEQIKVISGMNLTMVVECLFQEISQWSQETLQEILAAGREGIDCIELSAASTESEDE
jgi:hypothetical protein